MSRGFLSAGGARLEYHRIAPRRSDGPTLVLLHEGLGCVALWRDFPDRLATATGLGVFVYSRAGYGASDPVALPRPVRFMHDEGLDVLPEVLAAAGIARAVLVGHSDGGSIALIHAGSGAAERVAALLLLAPHVFNEDAAVAGIEAARHAYATADLRERLRRYHGANVDVAFRGWNEVWLDPQFRGWNIEDVLPGIAVPLLVIQGRGDEYGSLAQVDSILRHSGGHAEALVMPDCGHSPHLAQPERVAAAMAAFLERYGI